MLDHMNSFHINNLSQLNHMILFPCFYNGLWDKSSKGGRQAFKACV